MHHRSLSRRKAANYSDISVKLRYIGMNIAYIRELRGMNIKYAVNYLNSLKVGISLGRYAAFERGEKGMNVATLIRICRYYDVPLHYIVDKDMIQKYYLSSSKEVAPDNLPLKKNTKLKGW